MCERSTLLSGLTTRSYLQMLRGQRYTILKIFLPKILAEITAVWVQNTTIPNANKFDNIVFRENCPLCCRKVLKIDKSCDHVIDPRFIKLFFFYVLYTFRFLLLGWIYRIWEIT
jgi:hypothetical protein